jgi:tetratricopeptide (TPR) repeat protein
MLRAEAAGEESLAAQALAGTGLVAYVRDDYAGSLEILERALEKLSRCDPQDRGAIGRTVFNIAVLHQSLGNFPAARERFAESLAISRETGDASSLGLSLIGLGFIDVYAGRFSQARVIMEEAAALHERLGNPYGLADALHNLAVAHLFQGRYDEALALAARSTSLFRESGHEQMCATLRFVEARIAMYEGRLDEAEQRWLEMRREGKRLGDAGVQRIATEGLVANHLYKGQAGLALKEIDCGKSLGAGLEPLQRRAGWSTHRGRALLLIGDAAAARQELEFGLDYWRRLDCPMYAVHALEALADLEEAEGRPEKAAAHRTEASALRDEIGLVRPPVERIRSTGFAGRVQPG